MKLSKQLRKDFYMRKRVFAVSVLVGLLGLACLSGKALFKQANADSLSRTYFTFTNTAVGQEVVAKRNSALSVDISTHRFLAITLEIAPGFLWFPLLFIDSQRTKI